jgi:hypothetical protein
MSSIAISSMTYDADQDGIILCNTDQSILALTRNNTYYIANIIKINQ